METSDRGNVSSIVTTGVVIGALIVGAGVIGIGLITNPFSTATVDYSPPVVLTELKDLADYHAAQAQFEVVIDQEQDVNLVPAFIAGERAQYVAVGAVDAIIDFSGLDDTAIDVQSEGEDADSVTITLPAPTLTKPSIDLEQSYVMNRDRGLLNRVGGALVDSPTSERALELAAIDKMSASATQSDIIERAEDNTTKMLTGMLGALGFEEVTVVFDA